MNENSIGSVIPVANEVNAEANNGNPQLDRVD